ncbi:MAG: tRNA (adenosine(37)-N6)-threonylcarbamoyltransferase complex dimerization subunit type 1 TsaB [Crocinitomicaceae bacterium]|nr:tRNA (adenosine(37)-N6)-threonylcarbamoyltransferase complex dimerization subunit type 1 TsaB [Crocinitomicaceae bacterium]
MSLILHLETASKTCSVCISHNGTLLALKEETTVEFSHAENLNVFIEEVLKQAGKKLNDLNAVAVSEGPGSYTGLRIGTSSAKGLAYALDIPVIAVNSLLSLAALVKTDKDFICPMFDARRMEVFAAVYDSSLNEIKATEAVILDEHSFTDLLENKSVLFLGPGAMKCKDVLQHANAFFDTDTLVSSRGMVQRAHEKFSQKDFVNLAYFEPFYLKDFVAGEKKNKA